MESVFEPTPKHPLMRCIRTVPGRIAIACLAVIIGALVSVSEPTPAGAQETQDLMDRIERLERDIRTLNVSLARGDAPASLESGEATATTGGAAGMSGAAIARFDARIASIEEDVRTATGTIETLDFRIRTIESQLEKIVSDIEFRLSELEQGRTPSMNTGMMQNTQQGQTLTTNQTISAVPSTGAVTQDVGQSSSGVLGTITETELQQMSSTTQTAADGSVAQQGVTQSQTQVSSVESTAGVQGVTSETVSEVAAPETVQEAAISPKEQYTNAFGLLRQAKYDDAATALKTFIEQHPDDQLAPNARYWLGETYYVRSEYVRAAEVFFEGYQLAPTAAKAPDTLLKLGMALGNLNKRVEACAAFGKLAEEFPNASANVRNTLERERLRYNC